MFRDFEDYLQAVHAEQYNGLKDCMVDDYDEWLCGLGPDDFMRYGNIYARIESKRAMSLAQNKGVL